MYHWDGTKSVLHTNMCALPDIGCAFTILKCNATTCLRKCILPLYFNLLCTFLHLTRIDIYVCVRPNLTLALRFCIGWIAFPYKKIFRFCKLQICAQGVISTNLCLRYILELIVPWPSIEFYQGAIEVYDIPF